MKFRNIFIRDSETKRKAEVVTVWVVTWYSRNGDFSSDINKEYEAFTEEKDALDFKKSLIDAHNLLKNTNEIYININNNNQKIKDSLRSPI